MFVRNEERSHGAARSGIPIALALLAATPAAQATRPLVGIHDAEPDLVHPIILPKLKENSRKLEGQDLALNPACPFRVKLAPGKRPFEYSIEAEPKVGITRLIVPGLINAKLTFAERRSKAARFEIWSARDSLWICNHCGSLATIGGHEITFVDLDHDGVLGEANDGYVAKPPKEKYWADPAGRVAFRTMADPLVIDGKQLWLQVDGGGFTVVVGDRAPDLSSKRDEDYAQSLRLLNGWRRQLGHTPLSIRPELSRACEEHALYCAINSELTHVQDPKKPAASSKSAKAGQLSEITWAQSMEKGLRIWLHTFFHRVRMLSPGLDHVGMGHLYGVAVLDVCSGASARAGAVWHWPLDGAADVPPSWETGEFPSPLGEVEFTNAVAAAWGHPISVTFPTAAVTAVTAKVTCRGAELPVLITSPENPSHRDHPDNLCSILVMTRAPLPGGVEIQVDVGCQYAGKPFARQWRFTTRSR